MTRQILLLGILGAQLLVSCNAPSSSHNQTGNDTVSTVHQLEQGDSIVYESERLIIRRLSNHVYEHTSFLDTESFGRVPCNGMIIMNENHTIVFDTPTGNESSEELIQYIDKEMHASINAIIPTHFHEDCVAGLDKFYEHNIPAYASDQTIALLKNKGRTFSKPITGFADSLVLNVGDKKVYAMYLGEGHTRDNIIGYFPDDHAIFGGCLIKEVDATKGYLEDANVQAWSGTVEKLKLKYPEARIVIPGHGKSGGSELLDYTITLFREGN